MGRNQRDEATRAAMTAQHATMTQAGSDTGDVAIQALTSTSPFGFANAAEGEAIIASVLNLMVRMTEVENALEDLKVVLEN